MKRLILLGLLLLIPSVVQAATVDLGIIPGTVSFSDEIVAGSTVRIYAQVTNEGETDVAGYVSFFQGTVPIGDSQVISVRAGGVPEEVYVDFVIPNGEFNIRAEIRGTDPQDENGANDVAITKLFTPIFDDDGDGVENSIDNCPQTANESQADSDGDGKGNVCDDDDDNDGLTDDVENELGTSPTASDSDGDGIVDADDAYPTDPARTIVEPVVKSVVQRDAVVPVATPASVLEVSSETKAGSIKTEPESESGEFVPSIWEPSDLSFSPKAIFSYSRDSWNTFVFTAVTPETAGYQYQWDFGDAVMSSRSEVRHTYAASGEYVVRFRITDPSGQLSEDTATVNIRFWTLQNRAVDVFLVFLSLLLIFGILVVIRLFRRVSRLNSKTKENEDTTSCDSLVVQEDAQQDEFLQKKIVVRNLDDEK